MYKSLTVIISAMVLAACSDAKPTATVPISIQQLHKGVTNVVATSDSMTSVHIRHAGYKEDITVFALATDIMHIVEAARRHNLMPRTERVRFLAYVSFSDKYGNSSLEPVLGFTFDSVSLNRINFESGAFSEFQLVDLYADVWRRQDGRYSQNAIQGYCHKYRQFSHEFCESESF